MADQLRPAMVQQQQYSGGLFGNADHTVIYGGSFTSVGSAKTEKSGFQILQEHVAAPAFHNSKQRLDPPRCHENTRQAVLQELFEWIVGNAIRTASIAWLNGAAGAGKSAICQSIAEMCIAHGILVASFFFFRTDATRNTVDSLVPTIAYQIIQLIPQTKDIITQAIESNPLIFEQSLEMQLNVLIIEPLLRLQSPGSNWKLLLIIDGLDECSGDQNQMNLVRTIARLLRTRNSPFIVLFGSRRENHILMAFNSRELNNMLTQLPLDDNYRPDEDIRLFLNDSFDDIKRTHPFNNRLPRDWPSVEHVEEIIIKSSGQFIYASVVIKFLSIPTSNPSTQLDIVRGLRPTGRVTPFAQLDALYRHIFSQVTDLPTILNLLAYRIFGRASLSGTAYVLKYLRTTYTVSWRLLYLFSSVTWMGMTSLSGMLRFLTFFATKRARKSAVSVRFQLRYAFFGFKNYHVVCSKTVNNVRMHSH
ncbi:hypothetical protein HYPSUDRAFT_764046 [Hypholoma sublateritium FD-334 SS-4]|uniref:Nephrocystin 3-like N-terminal domain-containing protein n=1 Tax=Hypholoma sublateritium (strain FD-334 SS-4) TaxID=945553 RepID=A0A0D2NQC9_HYPSF|nr:hypothetical protein HYPSUDRAFT_764046 [Hypholoma sublateritium FD-334 SS-4]